MKMHLNDDIYCNNMNYYLHCHFYKFNEKHVHRQKSLGKRPLSVVTT